MEQCYPAQRVLCQERSPGSRGTGHGTVLSFGVLTRGEGLDQRKPVLIEAKCAKRFYGTGLARLWG